MNHEFENENGEIIEFPVDRIRFPKVENKFIPAPTHPKTGKKIGNDIQYKTIPIKMDDGRDIFIISPYCSSFGITESRDPKNGDLKGYQVGINTYDVNRGITPAEKAHLDFLDQLKEVVGSAMLEMKDELEKYDLGPSSLTKISPLYRKTDRGKVVKGRCPVLYVKLYSQIVKKNDDEKRDDESAEESQALVVRSEQNSTQGGVDDNIISVSTNFYRHGEVDEDGNLIKMDISEVMDMRLEGNFVYKISHVYSGGSIKIQVKLWEAHVKAISRGLQLRYRPPNPTTVDPKALALAQTLALPSAKSVEEIKSSVSIKEDEEIFVPAQQVSTAPAPKRAIRPRIQIANT